MKYVAEPASTLKAISQVVSASFRPEKLGSPGCSARTAFRSSATDGSSTTYVMRSLRIMTSSGSRVSGSSSAPVTSASGSSASTVDSPVAMSTRASRPVSEPAALIISSDRPSPLNDTTSVDVASSAGMASRNRNSSAPESRTRTLNDPSGSGAIAHRTTRSSSAIHPAYPGFSISLTSSPEDRCSRYTSCSCGLSALIPTSTSSGRRFDVPMIVAWIPSNGVRSRRASDSGSTSYSRQFSSPPTSCT